MITRTDLTDPTEPDSIESRVRRVCLDLIAAGIYPGWRRLHNAIPTRSAYSLTTLRDELIRRGDLDLTGIRRPAGARAPEVSGGRSGAPAPARVNVLPGSLRGRILAAIRGYIARRLYPEGHLVAADVGCLPKYVHQCRRDFVVADLIALPTWLERTPDPSKLKRATRPDLDDDRLIRVEPPESAELAGRVAEERATKIIDMQDRVTREWFVRAERADRRRLVGKRDRGPLVHLIVAYDGAMRRIREPIRVVHEEVSR